MVENNHEERGNESQEEQLTWIDHKTATNQVWEYLLCSKDKNKKINRYFAKCTLLWQWNGRKATEIEKAFFGYVQQDWFWH
jgi:hypothetical protein